VLTAQPRLRALPASVAAQLEAVRAGVDTGRLRRHVERLDEPRSRRHAEAGMARAESYVTRELESAGWPVRRRQFTVPGSNVVGVNLVAGSSAGSTPIVGAHLDTVPGSPGADDNASAVAALLELALILPEDRVRLVVFDEEETGLHGSRALARETVDSPPSAVVVLECVGYYTSATGTQRLPPGAALLYPGQHRRLRRHGWRGDWTLLAYQRSSQRLTRMFAECLAHLRGPQTVLLARDPLDLPLAGPVLRRYAPLARHFARSDHKPFWEAGVPAIQVTDTADFRNPHYHRPSDTPETLDYERIADIVAATAVTVSNVGDQLTAAG
jgi:Zn-dependent M28 family amino/carboxypeptidase